MVRTGGLCEEKIVKVISRKIEMEVVIYPENVVKSVLHHELSTKCVSPKIQAAAHEKNY